VIEFRGYRDFLQGRRGGEKTEDGGGSPNRSRAVLRERQRGRKEARQEGGKRRRLPPINNRYYALTGITVSGKREYRLPSLNIRERLASRAKSQQRSALISREI